MQYYVYYLFVENENVPFYVGKTFIGSKRLVEHKYEALTIQKKNLKNCKIRKAYKEGKSVFEKRIAITDTEDEALVIEKALIQLHGRRDIKTGILCNHTDGGEKHPINYVLSEESREKMSKAKQGNKINIGRKRPDFAEKWKKPITVFDEQGLPVGFFDSSKEACNQLGFHKASISDCLVGRAVTAKGKDGRRYRFRYSHITESIEPLLGKSPKRVKEFNI